MTEVPVPLDVVASFAAWLRSKGVPARTRIPTQRADGMVRISRVGGVPIKDGMRDQPRILIECWHADEGESFDQAQRIYGLCEFAEKTQALREVGATRVEPSPPVVYDDPYAPEMTRNQLTVEMTTLMGRMEIA